MLYYKADVVKEKKPLVINVEVLALTGWVCDWCLKSKLLPFTTAAVYDFHFIYLSYIKPVINQIQLS